MQAWVDEFKLALINEDIEKIGELADVKLDDMSYASQYLALINEATKLINSKKDILAKNLQKLGRAKNYLK